MSLIPSKLRKGKSYAAKKKQARPDWDSTVNDLTEFRATPEEVARRQEAHRSKNLELVRKSAIEKRLASARRQALGDYTNRPTTGNAFLREILYSNGEVDQILDDTSKALQVAHDIFADDARRYKAVPAITAINSDDEENAVCSRSLVADGLIKSTDQSQTKLEKLSESVMRKTALNETYSASSSETDSRASSVAEVPGPRIASEETTPVTSEPLRVDLRRFQRLIEQEELSTIASGSTTDEVVSKGDVRTQSPPLVEAQATQTEEKTALKTGGERGKITPKRRKWLPSAQSTDLKLLLESLESDLSKYERKYSIKGDNFSGDAEANLSMSTFTVSLINVLHRMMGYFNALQDTMSEERRKAALKEQQLLDLTNRTDWLTKELIEAQEQFHVVLDELNRVKTEQRQEIDTIKATVARMAKGGTVHAIPVTQPQTAVVGGSQAKSSSMVLRQSTAPATVTTHKEFEGSPEQIKLLNTSQQGEGGTSAVPNQPEGACSAAESEMTLEQRIEQLREDHQDTLERFRKLGMEMQKQPAASWHAADA